MSLAPARFNAPQFGSVSVDGQQLVAVTPREAFLPYFHFGAEAGWEERGATGLEPATSGVTGRRSNQLNYAPAGGPI